MMRSFTVVLALGWLAVTVRADNWPGWRGAGGQGQCAEKDLPLTWGPKENVRWKVPLPDAGSSTPIVWGDRVFVTQASEKGKRRSLMCLARADGKLLWKQEVAYPDREPTHSTNPYCSASPASDGERVVVSFGSAGMYCCDFAGKELWKKDLGKLEHTWGNASSPILHGDLAILWCGPGERQFLLAVDKKTGQTVWEHIEPGGSDGIKNKSWIGSWSTPIVARDNGQEQLIRGMPKILKGFDPKNGKEG